MAMGFSTPLSRRSRSRQRRRVGPGHDVDERRAIPIADALGDEPAQLADRGRVLEHLELLDVGLCSVLSCRLQSCGVVDTISPMYPFADKWKSFGWETIEIDGHDMHAILSALRRASDNNGRPTAIIAHTIKGKGVSFMENNNIWHARRPTDDEYRQAIADIEEGYVCR